MRAPVNQAAISMIVVENSIMKTFLKLTAVLGLAALMIPLSVNAQEQKHEQGKGAPAGHPAPAARAAAAAGCATTAGRAAKSSRTATTGGATTTGRAATAGRTATRGCTATAGRAATTGHTATTGSAKGYSSNASGHATHHRSSAGQYICPNSDTTGPQHPGDGRRIHGANARAAAQPTT